MNTRRHFIRNAIGIGGLLFGGTFFIGSCGSGEKSGKEKDSEKSHKPTSCKDLTGVSKEEIEKRQRLGYVDETPIPDNECGNCKLYLPPGEGETCGGCSLFKGPVEENGYCTYYAPLS